jgi:hypothetical protein
MINNSAVLRELMEMKKTYTDQNFSFTGSQKQKYDLLLELRRDRVKSFYDNGLVWVGPSEAGKSKAEEG